MPPQKNNILKPISIFLTLESLLGPSGESMPIEHATKRQINWEITANSSGGAEINKMAEVASVQNSGLFQWQSGWFLMTLVKPWRCYSVHYRTDAIVYLWWQWVMKESFRCGRVFYSERYLSKMVKIKKVLCLKFHYLKSLLMKHLML